MEYEVPVLVEDFNEDVTGIPVVFAFLDIEDLTLGFDLFSSVASSKDTLAFNESTSLDSNRYLVESDEDLVHPKMQLIVSNAIRGCMLNNFCKAATKRWERKP